MTYYLLHPERAGELGPHTVRDHNVVPGGVRQLHCEIDSWSGDSLFEVYRCFIATKALAKRLADEGLSGFQVQPVEVTLGEDATELMSPGLPLPDFRWLHITGLELHTDFGLSPVSGLVASEQALTVLRRERIDHCGVDVYVH